MSHAWEGFMAHHGVGDVLDGRVARVVPFGVFVEVADGVHGLLVGREQPQAGSSVSVRIAEIDHENRRLRFTAG
ncbi:S1 RNA-binding domain-containing protein [Nonomuraea rhizosphaerae]|uniref:S1 RNA-binding domain-containing protein n=1 Tax=Nonomuraea rhizosphaerae TaxID=2665663 RepID=UPI001C5DB852|nr:S1 RNA-binding domain-containing protein [Nonomuraea rhizosphaerae]